MFPPHYCNHTVSGPEYSNITEYKDLVKSFRDILAIYKEEKIKTLKEAIKIQSVEGKE